MKVLLLVAGGLAVAGLAFWQQSSATTDAIRPAATQLTLPATPTMDNAVAPAKNGAAVTPVNDAASAVIRKPASRRAIRPNQPAGVTVERRESVVPPSPDIGKAPTALLTYERRVADATTLTGEDSDRAVLRLEQLIADEPGRPEAYEAMAAIRLRQRDYRPAGEHFESALRNGGKATFTLIHDHSRGNFDTKDPKATCVGELIILANEVRFEAAGGHDRFAASWTEVRDAGSNRFFGSGIGGFHVTITDDGKYRNFNLAPESRDKAEGKLILDLLNAGARRLDRGK